MMEEKIMGYKVFRPDWTCRNKQYTCPGIFKEDVDLDVCERGMHFCLNLADCFNYYDFNPENHVAEVRCLGKIAGREDKCCTDELEIIRELSWDEVLRLVNTGKNCTGRWNTGNWNTGNRNTGDCNTGNRNTGNCNTGNRNTGDWNTGDWNTGNCNTGNRNTGNRNTGDCNTGNRNTGDWNTGDWNKSSFNNGCFMTEEPKIMMFNKPSPWTYREWWDSRARGLLNMIPKNVIEWIWSDGMTDEEKAAHPEHETTGGYLKVLDESECGQIWWGGLTDRDKGIIRSLPNFNPVIFKECTGIDVEV